jgi:hypothetical protein
MFQNRMLRKILAKKIGRKQHETGDNFIMMSFIIGNNRHIPCYTGDQIKAHNISVARGPCGRSGNAYRIWNVIMKEADHAEEFFFQWLDSPLGA